MTPKRTLTLHPYQAEMLGQLGYGRDTLLASPTGSGKTTIAAVAAYLSFAKGTTHAIIAAPQKQIEEGFVECNGLEVRWPEGHKRKRPVVIPEGFIRSLKPGDRMGRKILEYLADPAPGWALACSHAALIAMLRLIEEHALPGNLATTTLAVDEAHHAPAKELSNVVAAWQVRGGRLRFYTATPERADGRVVATPGMVRIVRSLAEHILEGFAPAEIVNELVPFRVGGDRVSAAEFTGEAVTQDEKRLRKLAMAIVARWIEDGRPKAIVRVPPMRGGCRPLVELLDKLFAKAGARIVDSTGLGTGRQRAFRAMLASERVRPFAASEFDVVIGSQRVVEGTDWPVCSHIYSVGIPGSLTLLQQLLGRATRRKDDKHPSRDAVKITFFYPTTGGHSLDRLSMEHSRQALLVCVFLADHESGEALLAPHGHAFDAYEYAQVKLFMTAELAGRESGTATVGELVDAARAAMPEAEEGLIDYVAMRLLANTTEGGKGKVGGVGGANIFKDRITLTPEIDAAAKDEFARLVEIFRGMTLETYGSLRSLGRQLHAVTGGQTREIAAKFREAIRSPLTEEMIKAWFLEWKERTGEWPSVLSGVIPGSDGETWKSVNSILRIGSRGLPGGSSVAQFRAEHFNVRNQTNPPPLSVAILKRWITEWHERHGSWPMIKSGAIPGSGGETWSGVDAALRNGHRKLPSESSLPDFIAEHFNIRNRKRILRPTLSIDMIITWTKEWYERKCKYPTLKSGEIPDSEGETWSAVNSALKDGLRGLPGGSSLGKFIAERFGIRNQTNRPELTIEAITRWIASYREREGNYPTSRSGEIPGSDGETWGGINSALGSGYRGIPGGSSLPKFIAEHFPDSRKPPAKDRIANHFDIPQVMRKSSLSAVIIERWITEWYEHNGTWPSQRSGEIPGSNGETWNTVSQALRTGGRNLPGGSSLSRFIAEHFNVRNATNQTPLTVANIERWIAEWKQRHGSWPAQKSGVIPGSDGKTWKAIDTALRDGRRNLPGGSSLFKFITAHFPDAHNRSTNGRPAAPRPEPKPRRPSNPEANPE